MFFTPISGSDRSLGASTLLLVAGLLAAGLYAVLIWSVQVQAQQEAASGASVSQAKLGKGTEALVEQTATHVSKLLGGQSIGGFPGFEPPDDERYKNKIRNSTYSGEEANSWLKEINNFLQQVTNKNPNMTLEEILKQAGMTQVATW